MSRPTPQPPMKPTPEPGTRLSGSATALCEGVLFVRLWALFGLSLFAVTWKLWTPQTVFPQVPVFSLFTACPALVHWVTAFGVVAGLLAVLASGQPKQRVCDLGLKLLAVALLLQFLLDQHRLQPWAWQWLIFAILFWRLSPRESASWVRWIAISIYVYSAISKLDYQFANTVGLQMLDTLFGLFGLSVNDDPGSMANASRMVLMLPLTELLVGIGLAFTQTRRYAGCVAMLLHATLILILSPVGMGHRSPVLIWNAFFIVQAYFLFVRSQSPATIGQTWAGTDWLSRLFAVGVICFPATCSFGICDHWLAWELYAPRSSRVDVTLLVGSEQQLPAHVRPFLKAGRGGNWFRLVDQSRWSLETLNVPVYPQARFQAGVGDGLARLLHKGAGGRAGGGAGVQMKIRHRADRWTGARREEPLTQTAASEQFWLNARATENLAADRSGLD